MVENDVVRDGKDRVVVWGGGPWKEKKGKEGKGEVRARGQPSSLAERKSSLRLSCIAQHTSSPYLPKITEIREEFATHNRQRSH